MAYTPVPTKNVGDSWTHTDHNTYIRDNFAAGVPDIFTTKGDLAVASGADVAGRLGVGSNNQVLIADSAQALGMRWGIIPPIDTIASKGDLIVGTAANTVSRLAVGANGSVLIAESSETTGMKWIPQAYARASLTVNQTIPNTTDTLIQFDTVQYDSHSAITTGVGWKYTVPSTIAGGVNAYIVTVGLYFASSASWNANELIQIKLYKNGVVHIGLNEHRSQSTSSVIHHVLGSKIVQLLAGDYIDIRVYQNSGASLTLQTGVGTYFGIGRIT